jgi:hypothetical protein
MSGLPNGVPDCAAPETPPDTVTLQDADSRQSLASRSVAGGGSVCGEVASSVPIIVGVISTKETTVA